MFKLTIPFGPERRSMDAVKNAQKAFIHQTIF
jgi:hypothetical protein